MNKSLLWQIRHFVYNHFAYTTLPPRVEDTARHFNISTEAASTCYKELHNRHAFFLERVTLTIRMANPFSGIRTDFEVHSNGKTYYANCAWGMLGIPAVLHSDAIIEAICTESNNVVRMEIRDGQIYTQVGIPAAEDGGLSEMRIHFPLPFARWCDDLTFT
jgi:hypothetical protein